MVKADVNIGYRCHDCLEKLIMEHYPDISKGCRVYGVPRQTLLDWQYGDTPSTHYILKLAALGFNPNYLLLGKPPVMLKDVHA